MNRKIIIIISVLICLCAALITAQHFANTNTENTTAPTTLSETPQTDAPSENATTEPPSTENSQSNTDKTESTSQTTKAATTAKPNTTTTVKPNTTTKPDTETTTKPSTTTTTKPNATTTAKPTAPTESTSKAEKQTITVTISINCEKALDKVDGLPANGYFLAPCKFTVKKGTTVFDVLEAAAKENEITLKYQSKSYIQAINGLAEKDCGGGSGWTYKVNGVKPNKSAAKYELAEGDIIEWYYVTSSTD